MDSGAIYSAMKNRQGGAKIVDSDAQPGLYKDSFLNLWRNAEGTYKKNKFLGFTFGGSIK